MKPKEDVLLVSQNHRQKPSPVNQAMNTTITPPEDVFANVSYLQQIVDASN
jgi:hypothetical protein